MRIYTNEELLNETFKLSTKIMCSIEQQIINKNLRQVEVLNSSFEMILEAGYVIKSSLDLIDYKSTYSQNDYISKLRLNEERKKSRCFIEYSCDLEEGVIKSCGFYSESWEVSKSTAHRWIKEFDKVMD